MDDTAAKIITSAEVGDVETLQSLLDGLSESQLQQYFQSTNSDGLTALLAATESGRVEVVKLLVEKYGASLDDRGWSLISFSGQLLRDVSPLWMSVYRNQPEIVKYFLDKSADVNVTLDNGGTPLQAACYFGRLEMVRLLIESGADVNHLISDGSSCLITASCKGFKAVGQLLVKHGAEINQKDQQGRTALNWAARAGEKDMVAWLLDKGASNTPDNRGLTPLLTAASEGRQEVVRLYVQRGHEVVTTLEQIEAVEVLGAHRAGARDLRTATLLWTKAIQWRDRYGCYKLNPVSTVMQFTGYREIERREELDEISYNTKLMLIQAALICERAVGPAHPDGVIRFADLTGALMWNLGSEYTHPTDPERFSFKFYTLWYYSLGLKCKHNEPLADDTRWVFETFTRCTAQVMDRPDLKPQVTFGKLVAVFEKCAQEVGKGLDTLNNQSDEFPDGNRKRSENLTMLVTSLVQLMSLCCRIVSEATDEENSKFRSLVGEVVTLNPRGAFGQTLLQLVSSEETTLLTETPVCVFPCDNCIILLTELGAQE